MSPTWYSKLIDAYRLVSWPYRLIQHQQMHRTGSVPVLTLFYHRVADHPSNDWTISCSQFEEQIDWLEQHFEIVDLEESQRRIRSGSNTRPTISITFDDGYAENCDFALPMLIERRIPVTYFVTTYHTTEQQPFLHDRELNKPLPTNSIESLRALDMAGVEIGGHSRTHVDLGKITCEHALMDEVVYASRELEQAIGRKVRYFAFPYGQHANLNPTVFAMLKEAGFLGVCSAYQGWNEIGGDDFHLQRIHGDPNFSRLKNWLTYDPRMAKVERFDYSQSLTEQANLDSKKQDLNLFPPVDLVESFESNAQNPTIQQ